MAERPRAGLLTNASRVGLALSIVLLLAGVMIHDVRARSLVASDVLSTGFYIAGGVLTAAGLVLNGRWLLQRVRTRRTAEEANFVVVVVLTVVLTGAVCYISTRRFARMDWTGRGRYSLDSQTRNLLRSLDRDIAATVLYGGAPSPLLPDVVDLLDEFRALSPHLTVRKVDWTLPENQGRMQEFFRELGVDDLPAPSVVFAAPDGHEVVPFDRVASSTRGPGWPPDIFSGEGAFAGAIKKLLTREKAVVYMLTGHGEWTPDQAGKADEDDPFAPPTTGGEEVTEDSRFGFSRLVDALSGDGYEARPLNLAVAPGVPDDCAVLLVAGPRAPITREEADAIADYLDARNGALVAMLDPDLDGPGPGPFEQMLTGYGVRVRRDALGLSFFRGQPSLAIVPVQGEGLADHEATADLGNYTLWFEQVCPVEIADARPRPMLRTGPLLTGIETSWGEVDLEPAAQADVQYDPERDVASPAVVAAVAEPAPPEGMPPGAAEPEDLPGPRVIVFGSSLSFVDGMVELYPGNLYVLLNSVNWMAGKLEMLGVPPKAIGSVPVEPSAGEIRAGRYLFMAVLPACCVLMGVVVWVLRRR